MYPPVGYIIKRRFSTKKFKINILYDKTTTKYKVFLFLIIKRQQTFFAIIGFYAMGDSCKNVFKNTKRFEFVTQE